MRWLPEARTASSTERLRGERLLPCPKSLTKPVWGSPGACRSPVKRTSAGATKRMLQTARVPRSEPRPFYPEHRGGVENARRGGVTYRVDPELAQARGREVEWDRD